MMTSPNTTPVVKVLVSRIASMVGALKRRKIMRLGAAAFLTETAPSLSSEDTYIKVSMTRQSQSVDFIVMAKMGNH